MRFLTVLHKDDSSDYGVTVPDLPGCFSAGSTIEEAVENTKEAIALHLEDCEPPNLYMDYRSEAIAIYHLMTLSEYKDGLFTFVEVML